MGGGWGILLGLLLAFLSVSWWAERGERLGAQAKLSEARGEVRRLEGDQEAQLDRIQWLERELSKARLLTKKQNQLVEQVLEKKRREKPQNPVDPLVGRRSQESIRVLNAAFWGQGLGGFRFFEIRQVLEKGAGLLGVELALLGEAGTTKGMIHAERLRLILDRSKGVLKLRFEGARRYGRQGVETLRDPWEIDLEPREPKIMSLELGSLCELRGNWPPPSKPHNKKPEDLENRLLWTRRLNAFLRRAFPEEGLRVHQLARAENLSFFGLDLLGYSEKGILKSRYHAGRLEIWTDLDSDRVELRFFDGFYQDARQKLVFPEAGFQLVSPALKRQKAERFLAGFCRRYRSGG